MTIIKDFDKENDARIFRDTKRQEGLAASVFTYGKDRYRVKVWELWAIHPESTQRGLSSQAWDVSNDIEDLTKIKELIADPDFGGEIEDVVFVAKKLDKERWFSSPKSVIDFFDYPANSIEKIKEMVDIALTEHDDDWAEYLTMQEPAALAPNQE